MTGTVPFNNVIDLNAYRQTQRIARGWRDIILKDADAAFMPGTCTALPFSERVYLDVQCLIKLNRRPFAEEEFLLTEAIDRGNAHVQMELEHEGRQAKQRFLVSGYTLLGESMRPPMMLRLLAPQEETRVFRDWLTRQCLVHVHRCVLQLPASEIALTAMPYRPNP